VKLLGGFKTVIVAKVFGASADLDAYLLAFLVPSFITEVLCGAVVPSLVPRLVDLLHRGNLRDMQELYTKALRRVVILVSTVAVLLSVVAAITMRIGSDDRRVALTSSLLIVMLPILPFSAVSNVWRAAMNAGEHFAIAAAASAVTPVVISLFLLALGPRVFWLAVGSTIGAIMETAILGCFLRGLKLALFEMPAGEPRLACNGMDRQFGSLALNNLVVGGSLFVDQWMASLLGSGVVSVLNYGSRLTSVLIALGPEALGITLLPRFSREAAENGDRQIRPLLNRFLAVALGVTAVFTGILFWQSPSIVKLVFQHGAFAGQVAGDVASVQKVSLLQLPFAVGLAFLSRVVASIKVNRILVPISALGLVLNVVLNLILMRRYSVAGIAVATVLSQALVFTLLLLAVSRILRAGRKIDVEDVVRMP
jgi:putative peptidoglycan lipid II flippase